MFDHRVKASTNTTSPQQQIPVTARLSTRTLMVGTVLVLSAVSWVLIHVLAHYGSVHAVESLIYGAKDCRHLWKPIVGHHCFSDYSWSVSHGTRANPWENWFKLYQYDINDYPAAALLPQLFFALVAGWLNTPALGTLAYVLALLIAVLSPAAWAARGAFGLERVVIFLACGVLAIPAWAAIDRGNSIALMAPLGLLFLVALCRGRWGVVAIAVVLAALVKPQFAILAVAMFAARQWRIGGIAVVAAVMANISAYLLWPRDFPHTITQSIRNILSHGSLLMGTYVDHWNVSFGKSVLEAPEYVAVRIAGADVHDGFFTARSAVGYGVVVVVVVCLLVLGRRIPPVMAGIVLLATTSLFPPFTYSYYLVFAIPIAALVVRAPDGPAGWGIFDGPEASGRDHRVVGFCVSVAAALSLALLPLPMSPSSVGLVPTTAQLASLVWLATCATIIVSYTRRPVRGRSPRARRKSPNPLQAEGDGGEQ